jgi:hypothetical protein
MTRPVFQCERCRYLEWREGFEVRHDRNGVRHHERCVVIARDGLVSRILHAAEREVAIPSAVGHAELERSVKAYQRWRNDHEQGAKMGRKGSGDE